MGATQPVHLCILLLRELQINEWFFCFLSFQNTSGHKHFFVQLCLSPRSLRSAGEAQLLPQDGVPAVEPAKQSHLKGMPMVEAASWVLPVQPPLVEAVTVLTVSCNAARSIPRWRLGSWGKPWSSISWGFHPWLQMPALKPSPTPILQPSIIFTFKPYFLKGVLVLLQDKPLLALESFMAVSDHST